MLRFLRVRHLAVIDELDVEFGPGLNVLTGETGAGKSILVEAVGLLLGDRASGELVRTGEDLATVEAVFDTVSGGELLVRREVTAQGRSRAFLDGELVTAAALRSTTAALIELHGQHEHHTLRDPAEHLRVIDTYGRLDRPASVVAAAFAEVRRTADELAHYRRLARDRAEKQELFAFQLAELDRAAPLDNEDEALAATRQVLASADRVERLCADSYAALYESDQAVLGQLGGIWRRVADLTALDPVFQPYLQARDGIKAQLEDLAMFLRRYAASVDASPARLQQVQERLALLERLKRKYGPTLADAIARRRQLQRQLADLDESAERAVDAERRHAAARGAFEVAASQVAEARRAVAVELSRALEGLLGELAMERARFDVRFNDTPLPESEWAASGFDRAEFIVSPNPGEDPRPLARIASGGELSRMMLAVKTLTAGRRPASTVPDDRGSEGAAPGMVFDEIDAGIGGRAADHVGRKLRALGAAFQVLCITHLPQIAAYADAHFSIEKEVRNGRTSTRITRLDDEGRMVELSRMLGGAAVTDAVRASAREMLATRRLPANQGAKGESTTKGESESAERP